jgi:hypothetical protein
VDAAGRATDVKATGVVEACVHDQMVAWRFPVPKTKDGLANDARFQLDLSLTPD